MEWVALLRWNSVPVETKFKVCQNVCDFFMANHEYNNNIRWRNLRFTVNMLSDTKLVHQVHSISSGENLQLLLYLMTVCNVHWWKCWLATFRLSILTREGIMSLWRNHRRALRFEQTTHKTASILKNSVKPRQIVASTQIHKINRNSRLP